MNETGMRLTALRTELAKLTEQAKQEAHHMRLAGESEYTIAAKLGVTRMTVRSWLGKQ